MAFKGTFLVWECDNCGQVLNLTAEKSLSDEGWTNYNSTLCKTCNKKEKTWKGLRVFDGYTVTTDKENIVLSVKKPNWNDPEHHGWCGQSWKWHDPDLWIALD
jgi:hypothetical protein